MEKITLAIFSLLISFSGFSQTTVNATVDFNGAQANGCCTVCGNDYWCINNLGGCGTPSGCDSRTFFDPVPAGNIVTNIQIDYWTADCYGNYITGSINGVSAPTVNENNTGCWCSAMPCGVSVSTSSNYPCGFPSYNYGGWNTLQLCTGADVCVDRVILRITYYNPSQINPSVTALGPTNFCQGGSVVLDAGGGFSAYNWNTGATSQTITVSTSGTYWVTVTSISGCTSGTSAPVTVTVNPNPTPAISPSGPTNFCSGGSVVLDAGSGYSSYTWSTGATSQTIIATTAGTYNVTVTDGNGCSGSTSINVAVNASPSVSGSSTSAMCGVSNGTATANPSGGTPGYNFLWSDGQTTQTAVGLGAGTYNVTITDANGCTAQTSVTVGSTTGPTVSSTDTPAGCSIANGTSTANPSGGTPNYTYQWSDGQITQTATGLAGGTYTLTVTDASGCTAVTVVTIPSTAAPSLTASGSSAGCSISNGSATANPSGGTPGYTYLWSDGQITQTATGLAGGTYTIIVTDANGCTATTTVNVGTTAAPTASASAFANVLCNGGNNGSAIANPSGGTPGYTYLWSNGQTPQTATGLTAGNYTVTVTDANGCSVDAVASITEPTSIQVTTSSTNAICNGDSSGTATVNASGGTPGYNYQWSNGQITATATGMLAGTYIITVTDANNCTSTSSVLVGQPPALTAALTTTNVVCNGGNTGSISVNVGNGTAPYNYIWNNGQTTQTTTGLAIGNYTVNVTDANGCTATSWVNISQPAALATSISPNSPLCNGGNNGSATANTLNGTTPYSYLWNNGQTTQTSFGLAAGTYTAVVTDANGCTATATVTIVNPQPLNASAISTNPLCNGGANGTATVSVVNGTAPYSYLWSNGQITQTATGLASGTYSVSLTDANGCTAFTTVTLTQPPPINLTATSAADSVCMNDNVSLFANVIGGSPNYTYNWQPGNLSGASISVNPSTTTTFVVTVTDANGCTAAAPGTAVVTVMPNPTAGFDTLSGGGFSSSFAFNDTSTGGISWSWIFSDGTTSSIQNPTHIFPGAGTYTVTQIVYNQDGCPDTALIVITIGEDISIPNVFTPDGDGTNDVFYIPNTGVKEFHIIIFDRWGAKVFETTADEIRWDGRSLSGKLLTDGTYFYSLSAMLETLSKTEKPIRVNGYVTLLTKNQK